MADGDIVLRDPGGADGDISLGGAPAPVDGSADAALPALAAAAVGNVVFVGVAAVALPALGAAGDGALAFDGTGAAALPALAADGDGQQVFLGQAAVALPPPGGAAAGAVVFTGSVAAALPSLAAGGAGALAFVGVAAPELPALTAAAAGSSTLVFIGTAAVSLPALGGAAAGALRFVGAGAAVLPALAAHALGSVAGSGDEDRPVYISLGRAVPLFRITFGAAVPLYKISLGRPMSRLYVGGTAYIPNNTVVDSRTGELSDNETVTFYILTPSGIEVELVYGIAPTDGDEDAVIRTAEGTYALQVALTEERGEGEYSYTMQTTGGRGADGSGKFVVYRRRV